MLTKPISVQLKSNPFLDSLIGLLASFLATMVLMYLLMGDVLFNLGTVMHEQGGDGLKNYFTAAYQYRWGEGSWFEGMHYPYGDFAVYTDAQLSLVYLLKALRFLGLDSQEHLLLILQGLPVLLLSLICFFVYKVGQHYGLPRWFSFLLGILAVAYSPHLYKLTAHFGLAYGFLVPAFWYFLLKSKEFKFWKTFLGGAFILLFSAYLHPYWILILVLFAGAFFVYTAMLERAFRWEVLAMAVFSIGVFMLINKGLDPIDDRPDNPWGMHVYQTTAGSLVSQEGFIHEGIKTLFKKNPSKEGLAYIGPLLYVCPLVLLFGAIFFTNKKKVLSDIFQISSTMWVSVAVALSMLALAMGLHLDLFGDTLLELLPPLKQFRSIGRFSWVYYYIFLVFTGVIFYRSLEQVQQPILRNSLFALLILVSGIEVVQYYKVLGKKFDVGTTDWLKKETKVMDMLQQEGRSVEEFQALLTFPPSIEGAEKIGIKDRWSIRKQAMPFIYQSGMPSTLTVMSRTSIGQALNILQLASGPSIEKQILKDLKSDKPFLSLSLVKDTAAFQDILRPSRVIAYKDNLCLFETPLSVFEHTTYASNDSLLALNSLSSLSDTILYYENFDGEEGEGLLGRGAYFTREKEFLAFDLPLNLEDSLEIELTYWVKIQARASEAIAIQLKALDGEGKVLWEDNRRDYQMGRFDIFDSWARIYHPRTLSPEVNRLQLRIFNKFHYIDEILCTSKGLQVYREGKSPYHYLGHSIIEVRD